MSAEALKFPGKLLDRKTFDVGPHFKFCLDGFSQEGGQEGSYNWGGILEQQRLEFQNKIPGGWAPTHFNYHNNLRSEGFNPQNIAEIGAGADATLIKNLMAVYPEASITVVELDPGKRNGAEATLRTEGLNLSRVNIVQGDAAKYLSERPEQFDMVDTQLLLLHLQDAAPMIWNESQRGPWPTFGRVVGGVEASLRPGASFVVSDMAVTEWKVYPDDRFKDNTDVQALVARGMNYIPRAIDLAWGNRKAHPWKSADEIAETVTKSTSGKLTLVEGSRVSAYMQNAGNEDMETALAAYIPPTIADAIDTAIGQYNQVLEHLDPQTKQVVEGTILPKMGEASAFLRAEGAWFVKLLQDYRIRNDVPTMHWQTLRKSA